MRRQTALKCSSKTLGNVKKLLHSYAIARPGIRLSVKVLKGKDQKFNWTYAPKPDATMSDAALQVVGSDAVAQCFTKNAVSENPIESIEIHSSEASQVTEQSSRRGNVSVRMLLPKENGGKCLIRDTRILLTKRTDFSRIATGGQYISIDRRPLSTDRGTPKEIIKLFKSYLQSGFKRSAHRPPLSNPLLCVHMSCPRGSYDVNIEPAKDDVLLTDSGTISELAEEIFKAEYGDLEVKRASTHGSAKPTRKVETGFDLLLARKPTAMRRSSQKLGLDSRQDPDFSYSPFRRLPPHIENSSEIPRDSKRSMADGKSSPFQKFETSEAIHLAKSASNMYKIDSGDECDGSDCTGTSTSPAVANQEHQSTQEDIDEAELRSARVTNPWSLAKVHGKAQSRHTQGSSLVFRDLKSSNSSLTTVGSPVMSQSSSPDLPVPAKPPSLLTPRENTSPLQHFWDRNRGHTCKAVVDEQHKAGGRSIPDIQVKSSRRKPLENWLPTAALPSVRRPTQTFDGDGRFSPPKSYPRDKRSTDPFVKSQSEPDVSEDTLVTNVAISARRGLQQSSPRHKVNHPFISQQKLAGPPEPAQFVTPATTPQSSQTVRSPPSDFNAQCKLPSVPNKSFQASQPTLASLMDYEHRKKALLAAQRGQGKKDISAKVDLRHNDGPVARETDGTPLAVNRFPSSPHENRYQAAKAALRSEKSSSTFKLLESDPRLYLMQNQDKPSNGGRPGSRSKLKRLKSTLLPLETIFRDAELQHIDAFPPKDACNMSTLREHSKMLQAADHYILTGNLGATSEKWTSLLDDLGLIRKWEAKVKEVVDRRLRVDWERNQSLNENRYVEFEINILQAIQVVTPQT